MRSISQAFGDVKGFKKTSDAYIGSAGGKKTALYDTANCGSAVSTANAIMAGSAKNRRLHKNWAAGSKIRFTAARS